MIGKLGDRRSDGGLRAEPLYSHPDIKTKAFDLGTKKLKGVHAMLHVHPDINRRMTMKTGLGEWQQEAGRAFRRRLGNVGQDLPPIDVTIDPATVASTLVQDPSTVTFAFPDVPGWTVTMPDSSIPYTVTDTNFFTGGSSSAISPPGLSPTGGPVSVLAQTPGDISGSQIFAQDGAWHVVETYDPATNVYTTVDGLVLDPSGTIMGSTTATPMTVDLPDGSTGTIAQILPNGDMLLTDGRTLSNDTGAILSPDGTITTSAGTIPAGTPTPTGTSAADIFKYFQSGIGLAASAANVLRSLGISFAPGPPSATGGRYVPGGQYRLPNGQLVTPTRLPNGLYQLPDGSIVGAPPSGGAGIGSMGMIAVLGAIGLGVVLLARGRK